MREAITSLDLNFTNAGGGHTASVTTVLGGKALDGGAGLGTVFGGMGEVNDFSNPQIASAMSRFICTQLTTSAGPVKKTQMRRYSDRTSLLLESIIVLVRGEGCAPEGGEGEQNIPYYSEVSNSPLQPFKTMGPRKKGSVIEIGRIYNQEAAAAYNGVKMGLIYQNKELKKDLCLNLDFVSDRYEAAPDLAQYELKFGYTLKDFKTMLGLAGVSVRGLPSRENVLFEASGTLSSVVSTVASYLGYFWFIDPDTGGLIFVDTETASALVVPDYTNTEDPNIVNASFTESMITNKIVNTYSGTTEKKQGAGGSQSRSDLRSRKAFFKNVKLESFESFMKTITKDELAVFFAIFNQDQSTDVFDKFTYIVTMLAKEKATAEDRPEDEGESILSDRFGERMEGFDIKNLYDYEPHCIEQHSFLGKNGGGEFSIFSTNKEPTDEIAKKTKLRLFPNRLGVGHDGGMFKYYLMNDSKTSGTTKMPKPSGSDLYAFLSAYFQIAGGIFVSNGYGEYKADRMQFTNTNNISISGPYEGKTFIHEIPELSAVSDVFDILKISPTTIKEMAEHTNGKARAKNDFFFVALKTIPKLERPIIDKGGFRAEPVDWFPFIESTEYFEPVLLRPNDLFVGGPEIKWSDNAKMVLDIIAQSIKNYKEAIEWEKQLPLRYTRNKTPVNKKSEEGEEEEDNIIADSSEGDQQESDLFDRFDMRYWGIEQPPWNILNKLSLSGSSGSTVEMTALRAIRGRYRNSSYRPSSSSRTIYGLNIPKFTPTLNSISLNVGSDGITTTVNESTIKLIPPDQSFIKAMGMEALTPKSMMPKGFSAAQRNLFGL